MRRRTALFAVATLALLGALAFSIGAQATQREIPQPRLGTWKGGTFAPAALLTLRFVAGAYELTYDADTKGMSGSTTCTLKKGTVALRLRALPNGAGWEYTDLRFTAIGSCTPAYVTVSYGPAIIYADGKNIFGQYTWAGASSSSSSQGAGKATTFTAALNISQVVPHPSGARIGAHGLFRGTLSGTTLTWTLTFSGLTGAATAAHIHAGVRGKSGGVLVPLCGPCASPAKGSLTLTAAQIRLMENAGTYANIHTAKNPNGEIRGQIVGSRG